MNVPSKNILELVEKFLKEEEQSMTPRKYKYSPAINEHGKRAHKKLLQCAHKALPLLLKRTDQ